MEIKRVSQLLEQVSRGHEGRSEYKFVLARPKEGWCVAHIDEEYEGRLKPYTIGYEKTLSLPLMYHINIDDYIPCMILGDKDIFIIGSEKQFNIKSFEIKGEI